MPWSWLNPVFYSKKNLNPSTKNETHQQELCSIFPSTDPSVSSSLKSTQRLCFFSSAFSPSTLTCPECSRTGSRCGSYLSRGWTVELSRLHPHHRWHTVPAYPLTRLKLSSAERKLIPLHITRTMFQKGISWYPGQRNLPILNVTQKPRMIAACPDCT